jgi:hypothetical protein
MECGRVHHRIGLQVQLHAMHAQALKYAINSRSVLLRTVLCAPGHLIQPARFGD